LQDARTFIFDMYNEDIYPSSDLVAQDRIDCRVPVPIGCEGEYYLGQLRSRLPVFLDSITRSGDVGLAIYTAGTDVFAGDDLGMLALSAADVLERDEFVVDQLRQRRLPTVMLLGGGYTPESHRLIAASTATILRHYGRQRLSPQE
jgi:histone deacetylase 11